MIELGYSGRVVELIDGVNVLDGKGLMAHVALLLLVVDVYGDVGRGYCGKGSRRGVCDRGGMVIIGRMIDFCRYTVETIGDGDERGVVTVLMRVVHYSLVTVTA